MASRPYVVPSAVALFECRCDSTRFGESVYVTGNVEELGRWNVGNATPLITSAKDFPLWRSCIFQLHSCRPGDPIEFKFFIGTVPVSSAVWESCPNRRFRCPNPGQLIRVIGHFGESNTLVSAVSDAPPSFDTANENRQKDDRLDDTTNPAILISTPPTKLEDNAILPKDGAHCFSQDIGPHGTLRYESVDRCVARLPYALADCATEIMKRNPSSPSLRQKFIVIRDILRKATDVYENIVQSAGHTTTNIWRNPDLTGSILHAFAYGSIYADWVSTGVISCAEDGGHHRPNQAANLAREIVDICEKWRKEIRHLRATMTDQLWELDILEPLTRRMQPFLPSFHSSFTAAVPLTRIRDIAHRNDISQDLKREIKVNLQNKLHRCAGPEDLKTATDLLARFHRHPENYPGDFLHQFEIFHRELSEFFNAVNLVQRLEKLQNEHAWINPKRANAISHFLANKYVTDSSLHQKAGMQKIELLLILYHSCTLLRDILIDEIETNAFKDCKDFFASDPAHGQSLRLADIQTETLEFALLAQIVNELEEFARHKFKDLSTSVQFKVIYSVLTVLSDALRNVAYSGFGPAPCALLSQECRSLVAENSGDATYLFLHTSSVARRALRLSQGFSDLITHLMPASATLQFGEGLNVNAATAKIYSEGLVRSSQIFQISRLALLTIELCELEYLQMSPYVAICDGKASGVAIFTPDLHELEINSTALKTQLADNSNVVLLVDKATGDEELDGLDERLSNVLQHGVRVTGIVLFHDLPALSHLGVRCRQRQTPFVTCSDGLVDTAALRNKFMGKAVLLQTSSTEVITLQSLSAVSDEAKATATTTLQVNGLNTSSAITSQEFVLLCGAEITANTCGAKAAACESLSCMVNGGALGANVSAPRCLVIPYGGFEASLSWPVNSVVAVDIRHALNGIQYLTRKALTETCEELRFLIEERLGLSTDALRSLQEQIAENFLASNVVVHKRTAFHLMVRSSSNVEDLTGLSGAGLYESHVAEVSWNNLTDSVDLASSLNVLKVWKAIQMVWASLYSERAILARRAGGVKNAQMAVLLQPLIPSQWSFVAHTVCPRGLSRHVARNQENDYIFVECAKGLGEALCASGALLGGGRPTRLVLPIKAADADPICESMWDMFGRFQAPEGGLEQVYAALLPSEGSRVFWRAIAGRLKVLKSLEKLFDGRPQDVEGCFVEEEKEDGSSHLQINILQTRPQPC